MSLGRNSVLCDRGTQVANKHPSMGWGQIQQYFACLHHLSPEGIWIPFFFSPHSNYLDSILKQHLAERAMIARKTASIKSESRLIVLLESAKSEISSPQTHSCILTTGLWCLQPWKAMEFYTHTQQVIERALRIYKHLLHMRPTELWGYTLPPSMLRKILELEMKWLHMDFKLWTSVPASRIRALLFWYSH